MWRFGLSAMPRAARREPAMAALEAVGMTRYAQSYPHMLSGGEQQRVALARAMAPRPKIMLMDEPFSGLDRRLRDEVREQTVAILAQSGAATVMVTHDPEEAMLLADRIALMRKGRLVQTGTPERCISHPVDAETAEFFSSFNRLHGLVKNGHISNPAWRCGRKWPVRWGRGRSADPSRTATIWPCWRGGEPGQRHSPARDPAGAGPVAGIIPGRWHAHARADRRLR